MKHNHAHTAPVFIDEGHPTVVAATDTRPDLFPASDAFGRWTGRLTVDTDAETGDTRPTHAPRTALLEAELDPEAVMRSADGRLLAQFRIARLGGVAVNIDAIVYIPLNEAAPIGAVWDSLFAPALPADAGGEG